MRVVIQQLKEDKVIQEVVIEGKVISNGTDLDKGGLTPFLRQFAVEVNKDPEVGLIFQE